MPRIRFHLSLSIGGLPMATITTTVRLFQRVMMCFETAALMLPFVYQSRHSNSNNNSNSTEQTKVGSPSVRHLGVGNCRGTLPRGTRANMRLISSTPLLMQMVLACL